MLCKLMGIYTCIACVCVCVCVCVSVCVCVCACILSTRIVKYSQMVRV